MGMQGVASRSYPMAVILAELLRFPNRPLTFKSGRLGIKMRRKEATLLY